MEMEHLREEFHQAISETMTTLDEDNTIVIAGDKITPLEALRELRKTTYDLAFSDWLAARQQYKIEVANDILSTDCQRERFSALHNLYKGKSVVPFIGAGMSIPSGYKGWTAFLKQLHQETLIPEPEFNAFIDNGKYEEAAESILNALTQRGFTERLENAYGNRKPLQGPVQLIPHFFDGLIVTTNFDDVLERCFESASKRFDKVLIGPDPRFLRKSEAEGKRTIIKLHGHADDERNRILTKSEYDAYYSGNTLEACISYLINNTLLFIGCSLFFDRTLEVMIKLAQAAGPIAPLRHYAFLTLPPKEHTQDRIRLLESANIFPIWYDCDHDEAIEALLYKLREGLE